MKTINCPKCGSFKIFKLRLDNDWASGAGDYYHVNNDSEYSNEELNYDSSDRPDIELYHCRKCYRFFE